MGARGARVAVTWLLLGAFPGAAGAQEPATQPAPAPETAPATAPGTTPATAPESTPSPPPSGAAPPSVIEAAPVETPPAPAPREGESVLLEPEPPAPGPPAETTAPAAAASHTWLQRELDSRLLVDTTFHHDGEDVLELWTYGRLRLDHRPTEDVKAVIEARARWGVAEQDTAPGTAFLAVNGRDPTWVALGELREAYLDWHHGSLGVRAGEQIFVWGKNEVLAAADVLSPPDLRWDPARALTDPRSVRQPVLALDASWWPGAVGVDLVVVPVFTPARVPLVGSDFAVVRSGTATARQLDTLRDYSPRGVDTLAQAFLDGHAPSPSVTNVSAALRISARVAGADLAATLYRGYDPIPAVTLDPSLRVLLDNADRLRADPTLVVTDPTIGAALVGLAQSAMSGSPLADSSYRRLYVAALEAGIPVGDVLVRADAGWSPRRTYYTAGLAPFDAPELRGALGVEYERGETWYAAVTAFGLGLVHPPSERVVGIDDLSSAAGSRSLAVRYGVAVTARWKAEERWSAELAGAYSIAPGDFVAQADWGWIIAEPHELRLGVVLLGGPGGTLGGEYRANDFAYVEYRAVW